MSIALILASSATFADQLCEKKLNVGLPQTPAQLEITKYEEYQRKLNWELAPIKTKAQLQTLANKQSPLDMLSPVAKQRFIDEIAFNEKGLTTYRYIDLEQELTPSQIYEIFSLFGSQDSIHRFTKARVESPLDLLLISSPAAHSNRDLNDYECEKRATCGSALFKVCKANC